jgi:hypothetical protein
VTPDPPPLSLLTVRYATEHVSLQSIQQHLRHGIHELQYSCVRRWCRAFFHFLVFFTWAVHIAFSKAPSSSTVTSVLDGMALNEHLTSTILGTSTHAVSTRWTNHIEVDMTILHSLTSSAGTIGLVAPAPDPEPTTMQKQKGRPGRNQEGSIEPLDKHPFPFRRRPWQPTASRSRRSSRP